jgi:hypothetical protein
LHEALDLLLRSALGSQALPQELLYFLLARLAVGKALL